MAKYKPKIKMTWCRKCHGNGQILNECQLGPCLISCFKCQGKGVVPVKGVKR